MNLALHYAGLTDQGRVRKKNEDNWTADPQQGLFIVADGMGGEFGGALAAKIVVETLPGLVRQELSGMEELTEPQARRRIVKAIATLSRQLHQQTRHEPGLEGMGSTVVCVVVRGTKALVAHMGDSRVYRLREGRLTQLTEDHSLVRLLIKAGDITAVEASEHPARGQLTRNVGMAGEPLPQARLMQLKPGDLLLLCSDGLTGMLSDGPILSVLIESIPLEKKCRRLIDAANQAGGTDNISVVLVAFEAFES